MQRTLSAVPSGRKALGFRFLTLKRAEALGYSHMALRDKEVGSNLFPKSY